MTVATHAPRATRASSRRRARDRVARLRSEIRRHDELYYQRARPEISDAEYDALVRELADLERRWPDLVTPESPTQRVAGARATAFASVDHKVAMLSLESVARAEDVRAFHARVTRALGDARVAWVCEPKVDGLGIALLYRHGRLVRGATRGDGRVGEDITASVAAIRRIPATLRPPLAEVAEVEVRGEIFMPRAAFATLNRALARRGEATFANPRNAAAGSVRQKDPRVTAGRQLDMVAYQISWTSGSEVASQSEALAAMRRAGLPVNARNRCVGDVDAVLEYCERLRRERERLEYDADGVVVKVDAAEQQRRLGSTHHHPRWAVALKFPAQHATTVVRAIDVQVGRTGVLTPVARVEPVAIGGVVVRNASLHNEDEIRGKDVRVGDRVLIERAGDVIPYVVQVAKPREPRGPRFSFPRRCPACRGRTMRPAGEACWRCVAAACPAQLKERLRHFASRGAMDIQHLGDAVIGQLVDRGLVRDVADLYRLTEAEARALAGFGDKAARNLTDAIAASRDRGLAQLLNGLGIRLVGERAAQLLARRFGTMERLRDADAADITAVDGLGPTVAESVSEFFADPVNRRLVDRLRAAGVSMDAPIVSEHGAPLAGKSFVVTGTLATLTRADARRRIELLGGRLTTGVSRRTDYLVVGRDPGGKLDDARRLRVTTLDEREFLRMVTTTP